MAKVSMLVFYTEDGVEICVASAKSFSTQLTILASIVFCKNEIILQKLHNIPTLCELFLGISTE